MITPVAVPDATTGAAGFAGDNLDGAAETRFSTSLTRANREARTMVEPPVEMLLADGMGAAVPLAPVPTHFCRRTSSAQGEGGGIKAREEIDLEQRRSLCEE